MAFTDRDIWLSQFIKRAMDFKKRPENWAKQSFQGIEFEPWINKWTRDIFMERKLPYYVNLFKDKEVFDTVYENLARKPELRFLYNPLSLKDSDKEDGLSKKLHDQIEKEAAEAHPKGAEAVYGNAEERRHLPPPIKEDQASETTGTEASVTMSSNAEQPGLFTTSSSSGSARISTSPTKTPDAQSSNTTTASSSAGSTKINFGSSSTSTTSSSASTITTTTSYPTPKAPEGLVRARKNFFSSVGRPLRGFLTKANIGTMVSGVTGAFAGLGMTAGSPWGALMGGTGGVAGRFWITNGGGERFLGKLGNSLTNSIGRLSNSVAGPKFAVPKLKGRVLFGAVGLFMLVFVFLSFSSLNMPGGLGGTGSAQAAPSSKPTALGPLTAGDILSCQFTRSGTSLPMKSSILAGWITQAANAAGISPQVLASVAMHENAGFVVNKDDNDPAIKNNDFCNKGVIFCEKSGQVFHSKNGVDDPCTPDEIAAGAKTAQAVGLMQNLDIYNVGKNLCSITESLNLAAAKLKANGLTAQPTQDQVNSSIKAFYNSCSYDIYSYCEEAWKDLQNCQPKSQITAIASCPVPNGQIKTYSYNGDNSKGHCSPGYGSCDTNSRRAKAIDVDTKGQDVLFPTINGQSVNWKYITSLPLQPGDCEGGTVICGSFYVFRADVGSDYWILHLLHLDPATLIFSRSDLGNPSGSKVGKTVTALYLHVEIGKNIVNFANPPLGSGDLDSGWIPSDFMCK